MVRKRQSVRMRLKARDLSSQETCEIFGTERMKELVPLGDTDDDPIRSGNEYKWV